MDKNKLENVVITNLCNDDKKMVGDILDKNGFSTKVRVRFLNHDYDAIRIYENKYALGKTNKYKDYSRSGMIPYDKCMFITLKNFNEILKDDPQKNIIDTSIKLDKDKLINAYNSTQSADIRRLLVDLFGKELFINKSYKVGDKFTYNGHTEKTYTLAKINTNVVTLLDEKYENFSNSIAVNDVSRIPEDKFKLWLGVHFDKFKLL